jgi:hypothetical protein
MILLQDIQQNLWVTIIITLFILSLISERLANLIKLYFQSLYEETPSKKNIKTGRTIDFTQNPKENRDSSPGRFFGNLRYRQQDPDLEKQREKGIQTVAVICGILIAIFSGADLFVLIKTGTTLDWQVWFKTHSPWALLDVFTNVKMFSHALGAVFAGLFISLGSKFWHDVLDLVLYAGNLKRKLADTTTLGQIDNIKQLDEFIELYPSDMAQMAAVQWRQQITQEELSNVIRTSACTRRVRGQIRPCLYVYLKDDKIPTNFQFEVQHSSGLRSPVEVIFIPFSELPRPHLSSGDTVFKNGGNMQGTLCCVVKSNFIAQNYALTCRHIMDGTLKLVDAPVVAPTPGVVSNGQIIGTWQYELFNADYDVALIALPNTNNLESASFTDTPHVPTPSDVRNTEVPVITQGRGEKTGVLISVRTNQMTVFNYNGHLHEFEGLLEVATTDNPATSRPLTYSGDSGAMVYDSQTRKPLGMIIGGGNDSSFAIPLHKILNKISCQIQI